MNDSLQIILSRMAPHAAMMRAQCAADSDFYSQSATLLQLHAVGETPGMLFIDLMMTGVPECDGPS